MRTMRLLSYLTAVLIMAIGLVGCAKKETGQAKVSPAQFSTPSPLAQPTSWLIVYATVQPIRQPTVHATVQPTIRATVQPTPTRIPPDPLFPANLDLWAGPVDVPLELIIPSLDVHAPVLGVGLTSENVMDAPKGLIADPVWHSAFWYRGSGIPGELGTAVIAAHVTDPVGRPEIFAHIEDLIPGQSIIVHDTTSDIDIRFIVDGVNVYSVQESSDPVLLATIFGIEPASDNLSHLTLITCAGNIVNGRFDHHTVVYATRRD